LTRAVQFAAPAEHYDRFMGRFVPELAVGLADAAGVKAGMRVLDVGCGPGGLTRELGARVGAECVAAIDPAPRFAAACRDRNPGADVRVGVAEELPWGDDEFDAALSSLVVAFMRDADAGAREMARVTRPGGTVAACMWDIAGGGMDMLRIYWSAVRRLEPRARDESGLFGTKAGDIVALLQRAGLQDVGAGTLTTHADYAGFDDFWEPFTFGVGPAGEYLTTRSEAEREAIRDACRAEVGDGPFTLHGRAWYACGTVAHGD
jgi:SAM-dependent methyltransferase